MALLVYEVARVHLRGALLLGIVLVVPLCAQTRSTDLANEGFKTNPDLEQLSSLLEAKRFDEVRAQATRILNRPTSTFKSPKYEQFVKANALYDSAQAAAHLGQDGRCPEGVPTSSRDGVSSCLLPSGRSADRSC